MDGLNLLELFQDCPIDCLSKETKIIYRNIEFYAINEPTGTKSDNGQDLYCLHVWNTNINKKFSCITKLKNPFQFIIAGMCYELIQLMNY